MDSLGHICEDRTLYNHKDALGKKFDFVIFIGTKEAVEWYRTVKPRWGKVFFSFYMGETELNNLEIIDRIGLFDGIFTYQNNEKTLAVFDKPVVKSWFPFVPDKLAKVEKQDITCVIIKHLGDVKVNFLETLAVFKNTSIRGITSTNPAVPYNQDTEPLRAMIKRLGLNIEVTRPASRIDYIKEISMCNKMISMDSRRSYGRWVLDAAMLNIPCIGKYSSMQELLMPEYMTESVDEAIELTKAAKPVDLDLELFSPSNVRKELEASFSRHG